MNRGLGALVVVVVAATAGYLGWQSQVHRQSANEPKIVAAAQPAAGQTAPSSTTATAKVPPDTPQPAEPVHPTVPDTIPDLNLPDIKGQQKSLRDYLGRPLIVNFWATWCGPCRKEIPLLERLRQTYRGERLEVVGVAVDFQAAVAQYLQKTPISYPLLIGEDQGLAAAEKFGMEPELPFSVFADAKGRIIAVKVGELHQNEADYILRAMRQVESGKQSLEQARAGIAEKLRMFAVERAKSGADNS
jgi:thiol-disulfide isomerase/thioredoxin